MMTIKTDRWYGDITVKDSYRDPKRLLITQGPDNITMSRDEAVELCAAILVVLEGAVP